MGASTFVIIIIFVLDLIAFGLGIGAEQRRAEGKYVTDDPSDYQWCQYSSDIATGLATGALLFLLTSQVLVLGATRCLCCGNSLKPGAARAFAVIFFILNWLSFLVAEICFLAGAVQNAKHIRYFSSIQHKKEDLGRISTTTGVRQAVPWSLRFRNRHNCAEHII
ncbi:hypothetical protein GOP47_0000840 [Adiantum capillus-veneris]|uniref:Uncharacterized protein n=1 Tax=Adiantum capillus-veneris TaxID=13818 RepID=A0A9D4ZSN5_ADICA|nr:hypothetical protein GOP47_0000840 [Adiantum capillus-veneris]